VYTVCREPEEDDSAPWKEQENWEGDQIRRALVKAGTKDRKPVAEQYEYVFENQIDFITDAAARGEMVSPQLWPLCTQNLQFFNFVGVGCSALIALCVQCFGNSDL